MQNISLTISEYSLNTAIFEEYAIPVPRNIQTPLAWGVIKINVKQHCDYRCGKKRIKRAAWLSAGAAH